MKFSRKIFCCDCSRPTVAITGGQKRCGSCRVVREDLWRREAMRKWREAATRNGTRCSRCTRPVLVRGCCEGCKEYVRKWKADKGYVVRGKAYLTGRRGICRSLLSKQQGRCASCSTGSGPWHVDHIMPRMLGGKDDLGNLQVLCAPCNLRKGRKDPVAYANEIGRLI